MDQVKSSYGAIYRAVKEANVSGYIAPGVRGMLHRAIDELKLFREPEHFIAIAERISITLHAFDAAVLRCDEARKGATRQALQALEEQWLSAPVPRS